MDTHQLPQSVLQEEEEQELLLMRLHSAAMLDMDLYAQMAIMSTIVLRASRENIKMKYGIRDVPTVRPTLTVQRQR